MRRRKHKEEEENQERWLLTYSDMITLLVAFFMMMYSMSVINLEKFKQAAIGLRSGFNGPTLDAENSGDSLLEKSERQTVAARAELLVPPREAERSADTLLPPPIRSIQKTQVKPAAPVTGAAVTRKKPGTPSLSRRQRVADLVKKITSSLESSDPGKAVKIIGESKGVAIELIGEPIFFPKESAQLSETSKKLLQSLARVLGSLPNEISVEGHASSFQGRLKSGFANSWELSTARGTAVVEYLLGTANINPKLVSITGYGHYRPSEGQNDRVRIFIYQD